MTREEHMNRIRASEYPWMNDDQFECLLMLCDLVGGHHHLLGKVVEFGRGIAINTRYIRFASFDYSELTTAVVLAHDRCIRFEIAPSGPGMLKLILHKRHGREGEMWKRHPIIEDSIAAVRKRFPLSEGGPQP